MRGHVGRAPHAQAGAHTPLLGEQGGPISSRPRAGAASADGRAPSPWENRALERAEHAAREAWRLARRLRRSSIDGAGAHSAVPGPLVRAGSVAWSTERDALDQATPSSWKRGGPRRPHGAGERPPRSLLLQHTRGRHGRPNPAAVRAGRPATGGRNRAAALQLPATSRYWAPWRPSSRARTARGRATAQHDVKGVGRCNSQRAQQREYREQHGHHPAPSASALRRGGARQPDIGSRSLAVQPGSWVGPLGADCRRTCPNLHRSAPPVHPLNEAWGDTVLGSSPRGKPSSVLATSGHSGQRADDLWRCGNGGSIIHWHRNRACDLIFKRDRQRCGDGASPKRPVPF